MRRRWWQRLAELGQEQWGLVTRRQAAGVGVSPSTFARLILSGGIEKVAHGVYRIAGSTPPEKVDLRAAWLQLAPDVAGWERSADDGVVSHRSAAALCRLGHLPADRHEFTLPARRQTRRGDVRIHRGRLDPQEVRVVQGLPTTRPSRIVMDLLRDGDDPGAIGQVIVDALRAGLEDEEAIAEHLAPFAASFGCRVDDGKALMRLLVEQTEPEAPGARVAAGAGAKQ